MMHSANTSLIKASAALPKIRNPFTMAAGRNFRPSASETQGKQRRQQPQRLQEVQLQIVRGGRGGGNDRPDRQVVEGDGHRAISTANGMLIRPAIAPSARYLWSSRFSMISPTGIRYTMLAPEV